MSLKTATPQHRRFAGQIAWERGLTIQWDAMSENGVISSSRLNGIVDEIKAKYPALSAAEWQVEKFQRLVRQAVESIPGFDASQYDEVPSDRASANQMCFDLEKQLSRVEYRAARAANLSDFVSVEGDAPVAVEPDLSGSEEDVPF